MHKERRTDRNVLMESFGGLDASVNYSIMVGRALMTNDLVRASYDEMYWITVESQVSNFLH